ncbi:hypothetical protein ACO0LC_23535 [Undibacterium sp. JH2W]|uniref:hypothetical protein n=1 Tax=Undibacterium sp. JH2W TaxID=3413037 RepID=UPI003BF33D33
MTTQFPNCPIHTVILPQCTPHTVLPQCLPQTSPVICHQFTVPPQCIPPTSPAICHVTQPPQCFPPTIVAQICHPTIPAICHFTQNQPQCGIQCVAATQHIPLPTTINTTIVQQPQTPVLQGGLAAQAPAQAQNFAAAPAQFAAQANVGPTGVQHCTATPQFCGNTAWHGCPMPGPTGVQHCTAAPQFCGNTAWHGCPLPGPTGVQHCTAAPQFCGNTAWHGCAPQQAQFPVHPTTHPTANTHCFICPPFTIDAQQAAPQAQAMNPTAATHCFVCPPHTLEAQQVGPTGVQHCTAAPQLCGHTAWPGCHQPLSAPPHCPTVAPVCPPQTIAPTHLLGCTCLPMTVGPVMTVPGFC